MTRPISPNEHCACGRPAAKRKCGEAVCARCVEIESRMERDYHGLTHHEAAVERSRKRKPLRD